LFEKNKFENLHLNTSHTDEMEAPNCGKEGFYLTEEERSILDLSELYCIPPGYYNATISG